ncbi:creatininase family protein [Chelatococcus sambhunathii]|uniref:Creatininase family protein n=1 Tax=Chelatococcus sambhunathii TaxID=363953 RepID=A0ABU1DD24_9HYPH|nr:creatininase family protein [Chelatococcus sambhunathii]MDR4306008.1 creatininase family protein [Chelatococcus sambhunathii]
MRFSSRWWWDLSTREFAAADISGVVAILPVGAVEQHGPHLPVKVDAAINAGIVSRAVELMPHDLPALVMPAVPVGKSNEHLAYPGTISLPYEVLGRVWFEMAKSAWRAGVRKIVFWNSHGGQPQLLEIVCRELRVELGMLAVAAMWSRVIDVSDLYSARENAHGIHGGESETSVMLHLHPELVRMDLAEDFSPRTLELEAKGSALAERTVAFGWQAQDLHPAGVAGNAAAADAARGAEEVERAARALVRIVTDVAAFPLASISQETAFGRERA